MFEALTKGFRAARNRLQGVAELSEDNIEQALRDVKLSLLEADVEFNVTKRFLATVKEKAVGEIVKTTVEHKGKKLKVSPGDRFIKICQDELESMMKFDGHPVDFAPKGQLTGIMMVGLQGSGKTTTAAKLARWLEKEKHRKVLLVAADVQRPGAIEQLQVLAEKIDVPVFAIPGGRPVDICTQALQEAKKRKRDTIVFDTAGRLAIDEPLMQELADIKEKTKPGNVFLVVDSMIGQDSVKTAKAFHDRLGLTGVALTKLDGDSRGGAAISIKEVTGAPIKFAGTGETMEKLEAFRADGMAGRILGFGDVVGLMKDFEQVVDAEKAEKDAKRMLEGQFTLDDFLEQIGAIQKMGSLKDVFDKLPFFGEGMPEGVNLDDRELVKVKAMVSSMTRDERRDPQLFVKQPSRVKRVAKGAGRDAKEVAELLQRFMMMKQLMGSIGQQAGMLSRVPGMKQLAAAKRLRDAVKTTGLEDNPMMSNLAEQLLEAVVADGGPGALAKMGLPGGMGFPGMGGMPGMMRPSSAPKKPVDKAKKKELRKAQKKARKKSRK